MLSRIAESLYWVGRYVERADDTARILDVHVHDALALDCRRRHAAPHPARRHGPAAGGVTEIEVHRLTYLLGLDNDNPSSIVSSLAAARENARGARESISGEMWECLNATWHALPGAGPGRRASSARTRSSSS